MGKTSGPRASRSLFALAAGSLALVACRGKSIATAELHRAGSAETHITGGGSSPALWADTDGKWHGPKHMPVNYEIDAIANGKSVGHIECDTRFVADSVCGVSVTEGNEHSGDCELKMDCDLPKLPPGDITLRVKATIGPSVEAVKNVSLNVREN